MRAVLDWLDDTGVSSVSLLASDDGAPLYVALGFAATREISMKRYRSGGPPTAG
jgi:hypothetical protein